MVKFFLNLLICEKYLIINTPFPKTYKILFNLYFRLFNVKLVCKKINNAKLLDKLISGSVLILSDQYKNILEECHISFKDSIFHIGVNNLVIINNIKHMLYRCSLNDIGSKCLANNYSFLVQSQWNNIPEPVSMIKKGNIVISIEHLLDGNPLSVQDVTCEVISLIINQTSDFYNKHRVIQEFNVQNELNQYDEYFNFYCSLWVEKLIRIKEIIIRNIHLQKKGRVILVSKTLIHGDLTYRNILQKENTFLFYDFDRSGINFPEFDIYLFYTDWLTHIDAPRYDIFFERIFQLILNDREIFEIEKFYLVNSMFKYNLVVEKEIKYLYFYRMIILSLQNFCSLDTYPIELLNEVIEKLEDIPDVKNA